MVKRTSWLKSKMFSMWRHVEKSWKVFKNPDFQKYESKKGKRAILAPLAWKDLDIQASGRGPSGHSPECRWPVCLLPEMSRSSQIHGYDLSCIASLGRFRSRRESHPIFRSTSQFSRLLCLDLSYWSAVFVRIDCRAMFVPLKWRKVTRYKGILHLRFKINFSF